MSLGRKLFIQADAADQFKMHKRALAIVEKIKQHCQHLLDSKYIEFESKIPFEKLQLTESDIYVFNPRTNRYPMTYTELYKGIEEWGKHNDITVSVHWKHDDCYDDCCTDTCIPEAIQLSWK